MCFWKTFSEEISIPFLPQVMETSTNHLKMSFTSYLHPQNPNIGMCHSKSLDISYLVEKKITHESNSSFALQTVIKI